MPVPARRERLEQRLGALVRAVLAPHHAEHRQLEVVWVAAERCADGLELAVRQAQLPMERLRRPAWSSRRSRAAATLALSLAAGRPADSRSAALSTSERISCRPSSRSQDAFGHPLGVRHQAGDVAGRVADARDGPQRAVRVRRIVGVERACRPRGRSGTAPGRSARAGRASPRRRSSSPRRGRPACAGARRLAARVNGESRRSGLMSTRRPANRSERLRSSAPGHEPGFGQHLEAVADAQDQPAARGEILRPRHDRREPRDDAGAEVVAVRRSRRAGSPADTPRRSGDSCQSGDRARRRPRAAR